MTAVVSSIRTWAEMVKLSHSVFALPFAVMAAFLAGRNIDGRGRPYVGQLALIVICMVSARSVAMTFNRLVDSAIDSRNPRTAGRPLPAGRLTHRAAWAMLALWAVVFEGGCVGFLVYFGNRWPLFFSGAVLVYLCGYSFTKRFTRWSHYYLGSAIALSPVAAWVAVHPASIGLPTLLLMGTVTCWVGGFDILYSCQDIEVDRRDRLYSLPSRIGPGPAIGVARCSHAVAVVGLILLGVVVGLGWIYAAGVTLAAALLFVENALVRPGDYSKVNVAFFTFNGIVSIVLAAAAVLDMFVLSTT